MGLTIVKTSEEEYNSLPYYEDHTVYLLDNGRIFVEGIEYGNYKEDEEENPDEEEKDLTVGSEIQPVYIDKDGNPQPLEYTIETSVPKDAKFSYEVVNESKDGLMSSDDKVKFDEMLVDIYEVKDSVSNGKKLLADAITYKGVDTAANDTFAVMSDNIRNIKSGSNNDDNNDNESKSELVYITEDDFKNIIDGSLSDTPYESLITGYIPNYVYQNSAVVYNGAICTFGTPYSLYSRGCKHGVWNGSNWKFGTEPPVSLSDNYKCVVVYKEAIHLICKDSSYGNLYHYSYNGSSWSEASDVSFFKGFGFSVCAVEYNNELHLLGVQEYTSDGRWRYAHYKWDGLSWSFVSSLNTYFAAATVHENSIYAIDSNYINIYNDGWNKIDMQQYFPQNFTAFKYGDTIVSCAGAIHIFAVGIFNMIHIRYADDSITTSVIEEKAVNYKGSAVVFNGSIHLLFNANGHYIINVDTHTVDYIKNYLYKKISNNENLGLYIGTKEKEVSYKKISKI